MHYEIVASSSKANCIIVEDILALDMGVSYTKVKQYLSKIKLIFISHSHSLRPYKFNDNKTNSI